MSQPDWNSLIAKIRRMAAVSPRLRQEPLENDMVHANDAKRAELIQQWIGIWQAAAQSNHFPVEGAWLQAFQHLFRVQDGSFTVDRLGQLGGHPPGKTNSTNPLEIGVGVSAMLLSVAGPAGATVGALMTAMAPIFGTGSASIDWSWVFSQVRTIVREEMQEIHVKELGSHVKAIGDWVSGSLASHEEWMPDNGSQFQAKLGEIQTLVGELMYSDASSLGTRAGALGFFSVAANLHIVLLMAAAERVHNAGRTDVAKAHVKELIYYLEKRYVPHAQTMSQFVIERRVQAVGKLLFRAEDLDGKWVDLAGVITPPKSKNPEAYFKEYHSLYRLLIGKFATAAMSQVTDTANAWTQIATRAKAGTLIAGVPSP